MLPSHTKLEEAISLHQKGELTQAKAIYEDIVSGEPEHAVALYLLGMIAIEMQHYQRALELIEKAIKIDSNRAEFYLSHGNALQALQELEKAIASYDHAININPNFTEAHFNRGLMLQELKQFESAIASFDRAIAINPHLAQIHFNRGSTLYELAQFEEALASFNHAININPDFVKAYSNRGLVLYKLNQFEKALESYDCAIAINPDFAEGYYNRGLVLQELKQFTEALISFDRAVEINPDFTEALLDRGNVLQALKRFEEALECFNRAIALNPNNDRAYYNRGLVLQELKQTKAAIINYDRATKINPFFAEAYWNKSLLLLLEGHFEKGWELYEWRFKRGKSGFPFIELPNKWDGKNKVDSLLILQEQGVGDQIFYAGMLNEVHSVANQVTACIDARLIPLYERSFKNIKFISEISTESIKTFSAQIYMPSLGRYFRQNQQAILNVKIPYLKACSEKSRVIRKHLTNQNKLICGLSWMSKNTGWITEKSLRLKELKQILSIPNIDFIDLQYGDTSAEQATLYAETGISLKKIPEIDNFQDIDDLASLIDACDIVLTVSNTTAHLASALGKEVLVMLPYFSGLLWYWHQDRSDSPWYPTARLIRQDKIGDWESVITEVKNILSEKSRLHQTNMH